MSEKHFKQWHNGSVYSIVIPPDCEELVAAIDRIPGQATIYVGIEESGRGSTISFLSRINEAGIQGLAHIMAKVEEIRFDFEWNAVPILDLYSPARGFDGGFESICYVLSLGDAETTEALVVALNDPLRVPPYLSCARQLHPVDADSGFLV